MFTAGGFIIGGMDTNLPSIEDVRARLAAANLREVHRRSGVPYPTVVKVASGESDKPGYETVKLLLAALDSMAADSQPAA